MSLFHTIFQCRPLFDNGLSSEILILVGSIPSFKIPGRPFSIGTSHVCIISFCIYICISTYINICIYLFIYSRVHIHLDLYCIYLNTDILVIQSCARDTKYCRIQQLTLRASGSKKTKYADLNDGLVMRNLAITSRKTLLSSTSSVRLSEEYCSSSRKGIVDVSRTI